jgi:NAD(P)-dependent dehydrogenase (short-subunit alcohol dehydrogenase family)
MDAGDTPLLPLPAGLAPFDLRGRTALVTGGTSGLGFAIARGLAGAGAFVVVASSSQAKVDAAVAALGGPTAAGGVLVDVSDAGSIDAAFEALRALLGGRPLHILVNAAGIISRARAEDESTVAWKRVLDVNLTGAFLCCQRAFRLFPRRAAADGEATGASSSSSSGASPVAPGGGAGDGKPCGGVILNIASLASHVALSDVTAYGVSKAGLAQLTKCVRGRRRAAGGVVVPAALRRTDDSCLSTSPAHFPPPFFPGCRCLASDWARYGIRVNAIAPGWFPTEINRAAITGTPRGNWALQQTPQGRFGTADELAGECASVYACVYAPRRQRERSNGRCRDVGARA